MKRKDFYSLAISLTDKLYHFAFILIPDDLQAEQLVVDSFNAYLIKEKKVLMVKDVEMSNKQQIHLLRRTFFKGILRHLFEIGVRRSNQLVEQMRLQRPVDYEKFYDLSPKMRFIVALRYDAHFTMEEMEELTQMPKFEIIENLHNGRFLLVHDFNQEINL